MTSTFKYLICLDFEATCWARNENKENAEIIEIGAVLLNTNTGIVESEFHSYVRPILYPRLSNYCINLTGITQSFIDQQQPFSSVYGQFIAWIVCIQSERNLHFATPTSLYGTFNGPNTAFYSWSDWDLGFFFKIQCQQTRLNISPIFNAWIDARLMYAKMYHRKPSFADALKQANIRAIGNAHSAIYDAINLSNLVMHLIRFNVAFNAVTGYYN